MNTQDNNAHAPRLGSAEVVISINDDTGFTVTHGMDGELLTYKPANECTGEEWNTLWSAINVIVKRVGA